MTLSENAKENIMKAVDVLEESKSVLFITGAGLSADSGLPTYRGIGGLYDREPVEEGISIEDALSGDMVERHPEISWKYIARMEEASRGATYNRGHKVIAEMEAHLDRVWVLTQNVDGFHHAAGSKNVIDIHGDMHELRCTVCSFHKRVKDYSTIEIPPLCPRCGEMVLPDVVFFGQMLSQEKCMRLFTEIERGFDIVFSVGTTSLFAYIAEPVVRAHMHGTPTMEINPSETRVSNIIDIPIRAGAAESLDLLWKAYRNREGSV